MLVAHTRVYQDNSSFATATSVSFFPHTSLRIRLTGQPCPHQSIDSLSCLAALAYCGPYSSEHLVKNSRQTCCADSGFLSPDPECRFVYFKCCGLRAARSIQVSDAHSGDINVGMSSRRIFVDCSNPIGVQSVVVVGISNCRLFFRARLSQNTGQVLGSRAPAVVSARRVLLILGLFGFSASSGHFQLHLHTSKTREQQAFTSSALRNSKGTS